MSAPSRPSISNTYIPSYTNNLPRFSSKSVALKEELFAAAVCRVDIVTAQINLDAAQNDFNAAQADFMEAQNSLNAAQTVFDEVTQAFIVRISVCDTQNEPKQDAQMFSTLSAAVNRADKAASYTVLAAVYSAKRAKGYADMAERYADVTATYADHTDCEDDFQVALDAALKARRVAHVARRAVLEVFVIREVRVALDAALKARCVELLTQGVRV